MLSAARSLIRTEYIDVTEDPADIVDHFKTRFMESERFFDKYARDKFGRYLLRRHVDGPGRGDLDDAKSRVEEALLFIEAAHACDARVAAAAGPVAEELAKKPSV